MDMQGSVIDQGMAIAKRLYMQLKATPIVSHTETESQLLAALEEMPDDSAFFEDRFIFLRKVGTLIKKYNEEMEK